MKIVIVASATGGSGKTTTCVRTAEALTKQNIPAVVVDCAPIKTAKFLRRDQSVPILDGKAATTVTATKALLKPYEESHALALLDTGSLDEEELTPWIKGADSILLTTRIDRFSLSALPGVWDVLKIRKAQREELEFIGFLPIAVTSSQEKTRYRFESIAGEYGIKSTIPNDLAEYVTSMSCVIEGIDDFKSRESAELAYAAFARDLTQRLSLKPIVKEQTNQVGLFTKVWRKAAQAAKGFTGATSHA